MSDAKPLPALVATLRSAGCVFAEDEARLLTEAAQTPEALAEMVARRTGGLPLEHVVGWAEFCGLRIAVEPGVFVPRPRTELMARHAAGVAHTGDVVVDLCCGSGAVGAVVAASVDRIELHSADVDPAAVRCARRNLGGSDALVHEGDLFAPLPARLRGRVGLLVANVPYVPSAALGLMPREARDHEPRLALDGGLDGLDVARRVAAEARDWLAPGGRLLIETSEEQAPVAAELFRAASLEAEVVRSHEHEATVIVGSKARLGFEPSTPA